MSSKLYCFDFDGTITHKDTLLEFIKYSKGKGKFLQAFLLHSPLLVLMKLHLYPNYKAKQKVFSYLYKGETLEEFNQQCQDFARNNLQLIREPAKTKIRQALSEGAQVMIVSASIDNWVKPFATILSKDQKEIKVLGTQIEVADNKLTGRFLSKNCYGAEKVARIKEQLNESRDNYEITAFGDSRGDKEMLEYADKGFFKPFRR